MSFKFKLKTSSFSNFFAKEEKTKKEEKPKDEELLKKRLSYHSLSGTSENEENTTPKIITKRSSLFNLDTSSLLSLGKRHNSDPNADPRSGTSTPTKSPATGFDNQSKIKKLSLALSKNQDKKTVDRPLPSLTEIREKFPCEFCCNDKDCSSFFRKSLKKQHCAENLLFYECVQHFKIIKDSEKRKQTALMVLQGFIFINSSMELNIEEKLKHELENNFEKESTEEQLEFPIQFFDKAFNLVKEMINVEEYPKFIKSKEFQEYFNKFGHSILLKKKIENGNEKKEEKEIMDDVIDLIFEVQTPEETQKKNNFKTPRRKNYIEKFSFEFLISDRKAKQFYGRFVGPLFLLYDSIQMYKSTNKERTRREIANMIMVTFLMPKSKLECTLPKNLRNETIKKFQFLEECQSPQNSFDELNEIVLNLLKFEFQEFFRSELFEEYYEEFGHKLIEEEENQE
eukprot:gene8244-69_t